jgi:pectate lyase
MPVSVVKRSSMTEACNIGYCTMNGGTTGGAGGTTVTVTTLDAFKAAAQGDKKTIIIVKGTITGSDLVIIGPNKSVLGADSSAGKLPPQIRYISEGFHC